MAKSKRGAHGQGAQDAKREPDEARTVGVLVPWQPTGGEAAAVARGVVPPPKSAPEEQVAKWLSGAKKAKKGT